jgi:hypothetical protein
MKIFVSIAAYRDTELPKTVKSLIDNAVYPDNLRIVILSQDKPKSHPDFSQYKNVELIKMDFRKARGAGFARKILMDQYDGEDYFFQIDSHMRFDKSWDLKLLTMFEQAQEESGTEKIILSQYPAPYTVHTGGRDYYPKGDPDFWDKPSWTKVVNTWYGAWAGHREPILDRSKPYPSHSVLAGYIFSLGSFVEEIPYDERISFMGEELCIAIRSYTRGWKIYAPNKMIIWHFYTRKDRPKVWSQTDDSIRDTRWVKLETESKKVQESILRGKDEGVYGIGDYEKYLEYQELVGINFNEFYDKESKRKINKAVLTEEISPTGSKRLSGWCRDQEHRPCETKRCECKCHNKRKGMR